MKASISIADALRARIASGELGPGDQLPSENDLAAELGYSKPTVREALRILETEGLIEVKRGLRGGPQVRALSIDQVAKSLGVYLQIGDVPVADVWECRFRLVGAAIERLAEPRVDLMTLERQVEVLADRVGDLNLFYGELIATEEKAVEVAGNATDHLVVVALRHIVEVELGAATAAVPEGSRGRAIEAERMAVATWQQIVELVGRRRPHDARELFEAQALPILDHIRNVDVTTVGAAVAADRSELANAHALAFTKAPRRPELGRTRRRRSAPLRAGADS